MTLGDVIAKYRAENGLSMDQFAERSNISKAYISMLERNKTQRGSVPVPSIETYQNVARAIGRDTDELIRLIDGKVSLISTLGPGTVTPGISQDNVTFKIMGDVAAGYGHDAVSDWDNGEIEIPRRYLKGRPASDFFVLRVTGNSMYPAYQEGDLILVLKQSTLNRSGEIGVILYDSEEATLKKVEYVDGENWMKMIPLNPQYPPVTIRDEDLERAKVLGIPRLLIRELE